MFNVYEESDENSKQVKDLMQSVHALWNTYRHRK